MQASLTARVQASQMEDLSIDSEYECVYLYVHMYTNTYIHVCWLDSRLERKLEIQGSGSEYACMYIYVYIYIYIYIYMLRDRVLAF